PEPPLPESLGPQARHLPRPLVRDRQRQAPVPVPENPRAPARGPRPAIRRPLRGRDRSPVVGRHRLPPRDRRSLPDRHRAGPGRHGGGLPRRDVRHGRVVPLKVISPEAVSGIGITQFLREIATVAHLQHPHILPLFDSGEAAGHPFYVMPYIRGGSLRARLQAAVRLPVDEAVALTRGIAAALQHAHEARVLHCDVKPENILLDGAHAYVMDFGIARKLHTEFLPWVSRKELDLSAGTPAYVSPEQASGAQELDTRTDVYSLACVVYEMLTGRTPFGGTNTQTIVSRRFVEPAPPLRDFAPDVPAQL